MISTTPQANNNNNKKDEIPSFCLENNVIPSEIEERGFKDKRGHKVLVCTEVTRGIRFERIRKTLDKENPLHKTTNK